MLKKLFGLLVKGYYESSEVRLNIRMTCVDPDGRTQDSGESVIHANTPPDHRALRIATLLLLASITVATCIFEPMAVIAIPPLARVTTAGLNALLNSTLVNTLTSATWFVGLMKFVASDGVTNGTTTFTSASGTFVSGDVGRNILLKGQGAAGADLLTTIAAVGSTTSITLGTAASATATLVQYAFECRLADTMSSHTSFAESTACSNATRPAWTPGTVSGGSVSNSGSVAVFNMNANDFIFGAFLTSNSTLGGSSGTLFGAGVSSGGTVIASSNGSTINVTITPTVTAT